MLLDYLTNIYVIALIATLIGLALIYVYDRFEKKQYTSAMYFRFALVLYISCFGANYISKMNLPTFLQSGGGSANDLSTANTVSSAGEFSKLHLEQFKTGVPTF
jgi:hypothetical protein